MTRVSHILLILLLVLLPAAASAAERDILEIAQERPLHKPIDGVALKYGDQNLAAAVDALADIARPWTVPIIIDVFEKESSAWLQKLQAQIDKNSNQMWEGWNRERKRCGHLAGLLAASRDPRAAVVLGGAVDDITEFPGGIQVIEGLYDYFLPDPRYRQLPPEKKSLEAYSTTNFYPEMTQQVRQWWAINKRKLKAMAKVTSE